MLIQTSLIRKPANSVRRLRSMPISEGYVTGKSTCPFSNVHIGRLQINSNLILETC